MKITSNMCCGICSSKLVQEYNDYFICKKCKQTKLFTHLPKELSEQKNG